MQSSKKKTIMNVLDIKHVKKFNFPHKPILYFPTVNL